IAAATKTPTPFETGRSQEATPSDAMEAPFELKPQGVLSGLVTDLETGKPIPNALIQITNRRIFHARTDMHGFYSIDKVHQAGNFDISVDALTHVGIQRSRDGLVVNLSNDKQAVRDFELPKACMVDVYVVDQNGVGIGQADVVATSLLDDRSRTVGHFANMRSTDPNGYVLLGGIPPGQIDYMITAWHKVEVGKEKIGGGYRRIEKYDYAPGRSVVQLPDPNVIPEVTVVLEGGQDISGYAEYDDGVPASGVQLSLRPAWWHCNYSADGLATADDGTFTFEHVSPGIYDVRRHVRHGSGALVSNIMRTELPPPDGGPLAIRIPEKSPQSLVSISGTITFLGEKTPGYVRIEAYSTTGGHTLRQAMIQANGTAAFEVDKLEPGAYTLTFSGEDMENKTVRNIMAPTSGLAVEMSYAPRPRLSGTVVDAETGQPIPQFAGRVRKLRTLRGPSYVQQNRWTQFNDPQGQFSLDTVGPGVYEVQIQTDGYAARWSEPINTDETAQVQVALTGGGAISGRVVDEQGRAIAGAKVAPLSKASGVMPQTKEAFASEDGAVETVEGTFVLKNLPPGAETLKATHPDYAFSVIENVLVREGATTTGVEMVLSEGATVEGRVYDDQGRPQPGQTLFFQNAHGYGDSNFDDVWRLASVITDANGFYRIAHLPEDVCYVKRTDTWRTLGVVRRAVVPRADRVTQLDFGGIPIVAGVVVVKGAPQANTRLQLSPAHAAHVRTFTSFATTDEHGAFAFNGVVPGTHAIYYQHRGKRVAWLKIATVEVTDSDLDLGVIPRSTSTLALTINVPASDPAWTIQSLFLAEQDSVWPVPFRLAEPAETAGNPWVVHDVAPGKYRLVLERVDGIQWRQEVSLDAGPAHWELSLALPASTAQVTGRLAGAGDGILTFWRLDRTLFGTIAPDPDGSFAITGFPAGKCGLGSSRGLAYDMPPLVEFSLRSDESRTIDVDLTTLPESRMAFLSVQVLDETGAARRDAFLWLEGTAGRVKPLQFTATGHAFRTMPGPQRLHVEVPGYRRVEKDVVVEGSHLLSSTPQQHVLIALKRR
ncbi:MAG: carboxypeptidase regulatory-like domain-containing protein, partial [Phycisphaerales bacterium]